MTYNNKINVIKLIINDKYEICVVRLVKRITFYILIHLFKFQNNYLLEN